MIDDLERRRQVDHALKRERQLPLPLEGDQGRTSRETKREAFLATLERVDGLRFRLRELLELAGPEGMTRVEMAKRVGTVPGSVCHAVTLLIDSGEAYQPFKRVGESGRSQAVVVLAKFAGSPAP